MTPIWIRTSDHARTVTSTNGPVFHACAVVLIQMGVIHASNGSRAASQGRAGGGIRPVSRRSPSSPPPRAGSRSTATDTMTTSPSGSPNPEGSLSVQARPSAAAQAALTGKELLNKAQVRAALAEGTRALTGPAAGAVRGLVLGAAGTVLLREGHALESLYAFGLIPLLQSLFDQSSLGSWSRFASLTHRFSGVVSLTLIPLLAVYYGATLADLSPLVFFPVALVSILNPVTGVLMVGQNLSMADFHLLRQFGVGTQGGVAAFGCSLAFYLMDEPGMAWFGSAWALFSFYAMVYALGDAVIHTKRYNEDREGWDAYVPPKVPWDGWAASQVPAHKNIYAAIGWEALYKPDSVKEVEYTACPSNMQSYVLVWTVFVPALLYFLVALSVCVEGQENVALWMHSLDYNFKGAMVMVNLLAGAQTTLSIFLISLLLHNKITHAQSLSIYGSSWVVFLAYVGSVATAQPQFLNDFHHLVLASVFSL